MSPIPVEIRRIASSSAAELSVALGDQVPAGHHECELFVARVVEWLDDPAIGLPSMPHRTYDELASATLRIVSLWTDATRAAAWELVLAALDDEHRRDRPSSNAAAA